MRYIPGPEARAAALRHPFVLAGLAVVALLGLTAGVLIIIDSARGDAETELTVDIEPAETATQGPVARTAVASGVTGRTKTVANVRFAPGSRSRVFGVLPKDAEVQIDGRTDEANWLRIIFPRNSEFHGWVDAEDIELSGDPMTLAVATPEPPVSVQVPTRDVPLELTPEDVETPEIPPTPEVTPTVEATLPDLVIGTPATVSDGKLFVTVINQGAGVMRGDLVVAVFDAERTRIIGGATLAGFELAPGLSIDVGTGYEVRESQSVLLVVDPNGLIEETDNTNNQLMVSIAVSGPPPGGPPPDGPRPDVSGQQSTPTAVLPGRR